MMLLKNKIIQLLLFVLISAVVLVSFRYSEVNRLNDVSIHKDRWLSNWNIIKLVSGEEQKDHFVISKNNKIIMMIYLDKSENYKTLLINNVFTDSVDIALYGSCVRFYVPLNLGRKVVLKDVFFKSIGCLPHDFEMFTTNFIHDYSSDLSWIWFKE